MPALHCSATSRHPTTSNARVVPQLRGCEEIERLLGGGGYGLRARATCDKCGEHSFRQRLSLAIHADTTIEDVDLLIRTGREKRLSDFLLFEAAYAELHFSERLWPDFTAADLASALSDYRTRDRRFGAIGGAQAATQPEAAATA